MKKVSTRTVSGPSTKSSSSPLMTITSTTRSQNFEAEDQASLAAFNELQTLLSDRVASVAHGYQLGAYIVGRPGTSKTRTVVATLDRLKVPYVLKNAKMTAAGLWKLLQDHPEGVIVLDDIPSIVAERAAQSILMAALGGEVGKPPRITMTTGEADDRKAFDYRGGIVAISNVALRRDPLADAIASRVPPLSYEPSDEMIAAFMRDLARKGLKDLTPAEGLEVVDFLIDESHACEYRLDLRAMTKAVGDYQMWRDGNSRTVWTDLVRSFLRTLHTPVNAMPQSQGQRRVFLTGVAAELFTKYPDRRQKSQRDAAWHERTGMSVDQLYRYQRTGGTTAA